MDFEEIGATLAKARCQTIKLTKYPTTEPFLLSDAYEIQIAMARCMPTPIVGWKVGLTSTVAQEVIGVDEPFAGPLFSDHVHVDSSDLKVNENDLRIVEVEIGLMLKSDVLPRKIAFERKDILPLISSVHPIFELANKRLPGGVQECVEWLVADGGINQAIVVGPGTAFSRKMNLVAERVSVHVNGRSTSKGVGLNAMGDPILVAAWLANHLSSRDIALKAGDLIATGLVCEPLIGHPGDEFTAHFDTIGSVTMHLVQSSQ